MEWLRTLAAITAAYAVAFAFHAALRWNRFARTLAWLIASLVVALSPCLVPLSAPPLRFAAAIFAVATLVKLYDLQWTPAYAQDMTWPTYALYLFNWLWLVRRRTPPPVLAAVDWKRMALTAPAGLLMVGACVAVFSRDYSATPFAVEHAVKVTVLILAIVLLTNSTAQGWRLFGGRALDPMRNPAMARTPADFWRRWNRPTQQFFHEYAFRAAGGARHPVRGILLAFAASGVVHEYVFGIASGYVQGWQVLFFAIQGLASLATIRYWPRGWRAVSCIAATLAFNLVLAVLFFKSVNSVMPFYAPRGH
jgi:hypothetical protein